MSKVSVSSLSTPSHSGWMTKQGGSWKNWKRRYFVLQGTELYYFKGLKDGDKTGVISLNQDSFIRKEPDKNGKKNVLAIGTPNRIYFMYPDTEAELSEWIKLLQQTIDTLKQEKKDITTSTTDPKLLTNSASHHPTPSKAGVAVPSSSTGAVIDRLEQGRNEIAFLEQKTTQVSEFWQIWINSIPKSNTLPVTAVVNNNNNNNNNNKISFEVGISADMEKLSWHSCGPQILFIQNMVDFFWHVGAPDTEIERLNDCGSIINPTVIGSWIDMSSKGGMDGGWYFPQDFPIKFAIEAADQGPPIIAFSTWAENHKISRCHFLARDMGASPPRQTEIRFQLPGDSFSAKLSCGLDAFSTFGFPTVPEEAVEILKSVNPGSLLMSLITSEEGFVRIGIFIPSPPRAVVESLCNLSGGNSEQLFRFEKAIGVSQVDFIEFQHLSHGFGYGVYREGFDVIFHYKITEDCV